MTMRVVNLCTSAVDVYQAGQDTPFLTGVKPGDVTTYVPLQVDTTSGALEVRRAGDSHLKAPFAMSNALQPSPNDQATVALKGDGCSVLPLWEHFGPIGAGELRLRFVDTVGTAMPTIPTRLYMEQADQSFAQVVAVPGDGDSGASGVVVPTVAPDRSSVRLQVGPSLGANQGEYGYQVPGAVFKQGAELFVFYLPSSLFVVGSDGPPPEIQAAPGDPPGLIRINPTLTVVNAVPDLCGTGSSHVTVSDAQSNKLVEFDLAFGSTQKRSLLPAPVGHSVALTPISAGCTGTGGAVSTGPLAAGSRYVQIVFGSAAPGAGALQSYAVLDARPAGSLGPAIAFFNAALGAPSAGIDVDVLRTGDPSPVIAFPGVAFGALSMWIPAPVQGYTVFPDLQQGAVASVAANTSYLFLAIGDWDTSTGSVPLKVITRTISP
jgi:hypothetical protein